MCSLFITSDLQAVILVGHRYGGMGNTMVEARMPKRIRKLACVDAALPDTGGSLFDQFDKGGVDPLSLAGLEAAGAYVENLTFHPSTLQSIPKTHVLGPKSKFAAVTAVAKRKIHSQGGWRYLELPTSHVPMTTMPQRLYRLIEIPAHS